MEFQNKINDYQTQLDVLKTTIIRYSDKQFELYGKLWGSLYDLKVLSDELWEEATAIRLERFSKQLNTTKIEIEKSSLFIEDNHYNELMEIINHFSDYKIGKSSLIEFRRGKSYDEFIVCQMIDSNRNEKQKFEALIVEIRKDLKKQIKGN